MAQDNQAAAKPSILQKLFGGQSQQPANPVKQESQNNMTTTGEGNQEPSKGNSTNENSQPANNAKNPLDFLNGMLDNTSNANTKEVPRYSIDPEALKKASSSLDLMKGVDPELLKAATGGDPEALLKLMQYSGQQAYTHAMSHNATLSDQFINDRLAHDNSLLSSQVKRELTNSEISTKPGANNAVVKKELTRIAADFSNRFPEATPAEIAEASVEYMQTLVDSIKSPEKDTDSNDAQAGEVDWSKYF